MAAAARRNGREREVASFDEGELWCSDEAEPALSPAGWYFRPSRGSHPTWIGPYDSEEDAAAAPFTGDALRDARRRLDAWLRSDDPPPPLRAVPRIEPAAPQEPVPIAQAEAEPATPAPATAPVTAPPQLALALDGQGEQPAARPRAGRRKDATAAQISFDF